MAELATATRDKLAAVSTATLTSCLFKRGLRHQLVNGVQRLNPAGGAMVGLAFTLRNIPAACNRATADFLISSPMAITDYQQSRAALPIQRELPIERAS